MKITEEKIRSEKEMTIQQVIDSITDKKIDAIYVRDQYQNFVIVSGDTPVTYYIKWTGRYVDLVIYVEAKYALGIRQREK